MEETWKTVPGYEGIYEVSDQGNVRALNYNHTGTCKELKKGKKTNGYYQIVLSRDGKLKNILVHRLVWEAFNSTIPEGMQIDHINGVKDDNRLVNLRCVTPKENNANPITAERNREAIRKTCNKPVLQLDKATGDVIREWECSADVERELGINNANISNCCVGKRKSTGGYRWRFA